MLEAVGQAVGSCIELALKVITALGVEYECIDIPVESDGDYTLIYTSCRYLVFVMLAQLLLYSPDIVDILLSSTTHTLSGSLIPPLVIT
jgi:hypothetical protein